MPRELDFKQKVVSENALLPRYRVIKLQVLLHNFILDKAKLFFLHTLLFRISTITVYTL